MAPAVRKWPAALFTKLSGNACDSRSKCPGLQPVCDVTTAGSDILCRLYAARSVGGAVKGAQCDWSTGKKGRFSLKSRKASRRRGHLDWQKEKRLGS